MIVATRLRVPEPGADAWRTCAEDLMTLFATLPGFVGGHLCRAPDEPELWLLVTHWAGVGAYRRALSSYDVKMTAPAVMAHAVPEPSAFEVLATATGVGAGAAHR